MARKIQISEGDSGWVGVVFSSAAPGILPRAEADELGFKPIGGTVTVYMKPQGDEGILTTEAYNYEAFA